MLYLLCQTVLIVISRSTGFFVLWKLVQLFPVPILQNLAKMQIPLMLVQYPYYIRIVWRQLEFAFFVRWLRLAHFFILRSFYAYLPKRNT